MKLMIDMTLENWQSWAVARNLPAYRAPQIHQWLKRGITTVDEMTNIPKSIRELLRAEFLIDGLTVEHKFVSALDQTTKYVFRLHDGNVIESVLMHYKHGQSVCISSQAGCKMGCTFCASTGAGFGRNLSRGEMLAQVARIAADSGERVGHVVIMGIGEPMDNYNEVVRFLRAANDPQGLNISLRHISVSTCGLVPEMLKFTDEGLPVTLSVSLHAPNDQIRQSIMPIAQNHSIDELLRACRRHIEHSGRRISFEYSLFAGVNDQPEHAKELAIRLKGMLCHVNLIPANEFEGGQFQQSSRRQVENFQQILERAGINATIRRELGSDINAACGQLRRRLEA
ncbi:MAG: 23S rRNA (adenine(2503)-C(2))-methyltransferase RlmN [Eubacteriales bacterium]|nr:23S rRNA (adenine(2503)-C(2))-methyltransferase RlmN [Eubacteriales bacterium]